MALAAELHFTCSASLHSQGNLDIQRSCNLLGLSDIKSSRTKFTAHLSFSFCAFTSPHFNTAAATQENTAHFTHFKVPQAMLTLRAPGQSNGLAARQAHPRARFQSAQQAGLPLAVLVLDMLDQRNGVWQLLCAVRAALQAPNAATADSGMECLGMEQQLLQAAKRFAALRAHLATAFARRCLRAAGTC